MNSQNKYNPDIFWKEVSERLDKKDKALYFVGGTLSVALSETRGVALNIDGTGFIMSSINYPYTKNKKVYPPENITEKVKKIYLETKGRTEYYKKVIS
jgi:hypothetical protein